MANWVASFLAEHPEYQARPVFRRAKHGLHFRMPDGTVEAWLTGKPCHFQDEQGQWQPPRKRSLSANATGGNSAA